ncbi:hypothetical protein [Bifidobacterium bifidum]|uniref:Uncharacterized protein n=1 Tax=Bifidobacterium bifidum ATCC 29521 = JCM 1255 = DSM 20456 TaxID=500634 RepID=A0ABN5UW90_BIFBI|nr:hypothetical protein BIFBIF_01821 [Bifidobacterium bifidum ATCC 29521 = JCM 1255 = DSM 20456]BAQ97337.1 hypothetical protein BBBF_0130 [Bifidobacterium bifidum ATCC 29521 = JCM 1255 = DSM 20456]GDZ23540.1 hypothetical protein MCC01958_00260 [Bifidobacteriaceae bacterium MCC01958]
MRQYTSNGRLPGYAGPLDLNVFRGEAWQWDKYANPQRHRRQAFSRAASLRSERGLRGAGDGHDPRRLRQRPNPQSPR